MDLVYNPVLRALPSASMHRSNMDPLNCLIFRLQSSGESSWKERLSIDSSLVHVTNIHSTLFYVFLADNSDEVVPR